jgi:hypothetical protein
MKTLTLPLGTEVQYRGMTGRDEDILTDKKKVMAGDAINEILANCTSKIGDKEFIRVEDVERLKSPDRLALLLAIRKESYGDTLDASLECPDENCRHKFEVEVDLATLPEKPVVGESPFEVKLGTGHVVLFDYMDGRKEKALLKVKDNVITAVLQFRIQEVIAEDGTAVHPNDLKKWLMDLPVRERSALRKAMDDVDCGPDPVVTAQCVACGTEISFNVMQEQASFFFPAT